MPDRVGPVVEAELDAGCEEIRDLFPRRWGKPFVDHVAAERQWQTIIFTPPPRTQILAQFELLIPVGQLALMNDQPHLGPPGLHRGKNLVEGNDQAIQFTGGFIQPELQRQKRARHGPRHSDALPRDLGA